MYKKFNILGIILFAATGLMAFGYYKAVCSTGVCTSSTINNLLRPVELGSKVLVVLFLLLIFFPESYFKKWLKYIFSWGFPLAVYMTYITTGSSSIPAYGKVHVVKFWGVVFAVITIVFVVFQYYQSRNKK
jgi:hypothetical protein